MFIVIARSSSDEAISVRFPVILREHFAFSVILSEAKNLLKLSVNSATEESQWGGVARLPRFARNDIRKKARNDKNHQVHTLA